MNRALTPQQFIDCIDANFVPHLFLDRRYGIHRMRSECGVLWYFIRDAEGHSCMQIDARADRRRMVARIAIGGGAIELHINYRTGDIVVSFDEAGTGVYSRAVVVSAFDYEHMFTVLMEHCKQLLGIATDDDPHLPYYRPHHLAAADRL